MWSLGQLDAELLGYTSNLLCRIPEITTFWNVRREVLKALTKRVCIILSLCYIQTRCGFKILEFLFWWEGYNDERSRKVTGLFAISARYWPFLQEGNSEKKAVYKDVNELYLDELILTENCLQVFPSHHFCFALFDLVSFCNWQCFKVWDE